MANLNYYEMQHKSITVKMAAIERSTAEFVEYEFPKLQGYLEDGWKIGETHFSTTEQNVGFIFITYNLTKN